jgi:hypothetical protein
MIIQSRIQRQALQNGASLRAIGMCSLAILCGSVVAACSGTIETPTEEFPARTSGSRPAADDDDNAAPTRTPAPAAPASNPPVASANDDDDPPVAPAAGEDDPPAAEDPPAEEDPPPATVDLSFEDDIHPIFESTCGPCHAATAQSGVSIADSDIESALENAVDREDRVLARIEQGTMPPGCAGGALGDSGCMSEADFADVEAWYAAGAPP